MKRFDTIYRRAKETLAKPEVKRRIALGSVILGLCGFLVLLVFTFYPSLKTNASPSTVVDGTSNLGTAYSSNRKVVRTTNGANGNRTFVIGYTGAGLILYYSDNPEAASPTWTTAGTLITTTTHFIGDMVWDEVNNVLYIAYGRDVIADAAASDIFYRRISTLGGTPVLGAQQIALDASNTINYIHPKIEISQDSSVTKVFVFATEQTDAGNPARLALRTGTINADAPTWDTIYYVKSWTAAANASILGVSR